MARLAPLVCRLDGVSPHRLARDFIQQLPGGLLDDAGHERELLEAPVLIRPTSGARCFLPVTEDRRSPALLVG